MSTHRWTAFSIGRIALGDVFLKGLFVSGHFQDHSSRTPILPLAIS